MSETAPGSLAAALVQLQARLPRIGKDAEADTGKYKYRYADLATITAAIFPLLAELGLYWSCQPTMREDGQFVLHYELGHSHAGSSITGDYPLPNATPQTIGGAITYARRYALCAVTGVVADEDDDATAAEAEARKPKSRSEERTAAGLMTSAQSRAHDRLVRETVAQPKLAERSRPGAPQVDDWTTPDPGQAAPSSGAQRNAIATLAAKLGARDDDDRHELIRQALDLDAPASSTEITAADASKVIKWMQGKADM